MTSKYVLLATIFCGMASPALAQQGQSVTPQQQNAPRQSPFERADINNDGVITRDEVRTARTATFNRLDANKDGFLVQSEMPPPPHGQRGGPGNRQGPLGARPFHMGGVSPGDADANKDGTITRAEYDAAWQAGDISNAAAVSAQRTSMFVFLDVDRDGIISSAEIASSSSRRQTFQMDRRNMPPGSFPRREAGARAKNRPNPDTNNDQRVSLAEWLARPDPLFERGDANNDGRVTREEAAATMRQGRVTIGSSKRPW